MKSQIDDFLLTIAITGSPENPSFGVSLDPERSRHIPNACDSCEDTIEDLTDQLRTLGVGVEPCKKNIAMMMREPGRQLKCQETLIALSKALEDYKTRHHGHWRWTVAYKGRQHGLQGYKALFLLVSRSVEEDYGYAGKQAAVRINDLAVCFTWQIVTDEGVGSHIHRDADLTTGKESQLQGRNLVPILILSL